MQAPPMAATTGLGLASTISITVCKLGSANALGVPNSLMSAPPEKARSEPIRTTAWTLLSARAASMPATICVRNAWLKPLTGGLLSVMTATLPRSS